jgi:putative intracellular protease/amidase
MFSADRTRGRIRLLAIAIAAALTVASSTSSADDDRKPEKSDDLIELTNLDRDTVAGQWRNTPDGLLTAAESGARISLPVEPKGEYDFKVTFTRQTGRHSITLLFVTGRGQAAFDLDAWGQHLAGFQNVGGKDARQNATRVEDVTLINGRKYTAELRVRRDRVDAYLDGKLLSTYRGDGSDLSVLGNWKIPSSRTLGIGAWDSETLFHSIEVRSVNGTIDLASTGSAPRPRRPSTNPMPKAAASTNPSRGKRPAADGGDRVLIVIANDGFFYREYADPRQELERAGFTVDVAAARRAPCRPHANSGQGGSDGVVHPDLSISDADPKRYRAILFSGGWGSSMYQYAFQGRYNNSAYNGDRLTKEATNRLINAFVDQDKYVCALCHGVSVLAWSRVNGRSLLFGRRATGPTRQGPAGIYNGRQSQPSSRWGSEQNGARMVTPNSVGNPSTAADDIVIDGKIMTGQDDISAREMGRQLAKQLKGSS